MKCVTSIILPLITYAGVRLITYLNSKIKDENARIRECNEIEKIIRMADDF